MSKHVKQVLAQALELPPIERAELVENLLSSFEFSSREAVDALWAQEAESRIDALEGGKLHSTSAQEVFSKIEKSKSE